MAHFLLNYDLNKTKDYTKLIAELTRVKAAKCALSTWFVEVDTNDQFVVRNHFQQYVDQDDRIVVVKFSTAPAWLNILPAGKAWADARYAS